MRRNLAGRASISVSVWIVAPGTISSDSYELIALRSLATEIWRVNVVPKTVKGIDSVLE